MKGITAELALVNTFRQLDPHYTYTDSTAVDMEEEEVGVYNIDPDIEMDHVDFVEHQIEKNGRFLEKFYIIFHYVTC